MAGNHKYLQARGGTADRAYGSARPQSARLEYTSAGLAALDAGPATFSIFTAMYQFRKPDDNTERLDNLERVFQAISSASSKSRQLEPTYMFSGKGR